MSDVAAGLTIRDLGRMPYAEALALQRELQRQAIEARPAAGPMFLLLVEHDPPVITISRRPDARRHLTATAAQLAAAGVEVAETDRGGDITYHGPGQLVAYPILDLNALGLRVNGYMRMLEEVVIATIARFGVEGVRNPGATGVWVERAGSLAKVCAMGVRISRWVSMHGLALNVTTDLAHFDLIVPCGLAGAAVTSLERESGGRCPSMEQVKAALGDQVRGAVAARFTRSEATAPPGRRR